ncbi:MAG: methyltransferase [Leptolyngbyaceae cyanobacterium RM2_2_4]|nr:methyltransferase [Leptolyngbyaceae cyanobacterium SM1_4_3]NJO53209.1 methyltransferase [Leptolyngbyaceae cyanobacterium RM2_2_4]
MSETRTSYDVIYEVVRLIPEGRVATYGQVAALADLPGQARLVGYALYRVDMSLADIPWHRVINAKGEVSESPLRYGTDYLQRSLLEQEGIQFSHEGKVDLNEYRWRPELPIRGMRGAHAEL